MDTSSNQATNNLSINKLNAKEANEIFNYINFRLDNNSDSKEVMKLMQLRAEVEKHLDSIVL